MSCNSVAADINSATKTTTVETTDILALVRNSVLYGVTFSNFQTALGVTGQIKPLGSATAVQILNQPSSNLNYIRNISPTQGITAVVDAQGNINLKTNLANAGVTANGSGLIVDQTAAQVKFKRIKAGAGITIAETAESVEVTSTNVALTSKTVIISTVEDFPAPAAGVITLADNTDYFLADDVSTSNRFVLGESVSLRGPASQIVTLEYTGTGTMFTATAPNFRGDRLTLSAPTGQLLDISGGGTGIFQLIEVTVDTCDTIGSFSDMFLVRLKGLAWQNIITNGVTFSGVNDLLVLDTSVLFLNGGTAYDLGTATFNAITITNQFVKSTTGGTKFIDGATASANVTVGGLAVVSNCHTETVTAPLTGVSTDDGRWEFADNNDIQNTRPDAMGAFLTPTTTVLAAATPALITGTWTAERVSQMTLSAAGRATYTGEMGATLPITATVGLEPVSGTNKTVNLYLSKNGSLVANSKIAAIISSGSPKYQTLVWQDSFVLGDYYEVFIESVDGTDLQVNNAFFRIN